MAGAMRYGTVEQYVATFDETERRELTSATVALIIANALERAAIRSPVSVGEIDPHLLRAYLHELGHDVRVTPLTTPGGKQ